MHSDDMYVSQPAGSSGPDSSLAERAWAFLHQARPTLGLDDIQVRRVALRLASLRAPARRTLLRPALAALAVLLLAGTAVALVGARRGQHVPPTVRPSVEAEAPRGQTRQPAQDPGDGVYEEARSLTAALERWHREHDAEGALALLDQHRARFSRGSMGLEVQLVRAEILLARQRDGEALQALDSVALAGLPRARELLTIRGELRVKAKRCVQAREDLQAVLAAKIPGALSERAARALAACR